MIERESGQVTNDFVTVNRRLWRSWSTSVLLKHKIKHRTYHLQNFLYVVLKLDNGSVSMRRSQFQPGNNML